MERQGSRAGEATALAVLLLGAALVLEAACVVAGAQRFRAALRTTGEIEALLDFVRAPLERLYAMAALLGPLVAARARLLAAWRPVELVRPRRPWARAAWALGWSFVAPVALGAAWLALGGDFQLRRLGEAAALYAASVLLVELLPRQLPRLVGPRAWRAALAGALLAAAADRLAPGALQAMGMALVHSAGPWTGDAPRGFAARLWLAAMVGAALVLTWLARRGEPPRLRAALLVALGLVVAALTG